MGLPLIERKTPLARLLGGLPKAAVPPERFRR